MKNANRTIISNFTPRGVVIGYNLHNELYVKLREKYGNVTDDVFNTTFFFKYKGCWHNLGDFTRIRIDGTNWGWSDGKVVVDGRYVRNDKIIVGRFL